MTGTRSVGVKGDDRTYNFVIAVRAVTTDDFMTCEYAPLPHKLLKPDILTDHKRDTAGEPGCLRYYIKAPGNGGMGVGL